MLSSRLRLLVSTLYAYSPFLNQKVHSRFLKMFVDTETQTVFGIKSVNTSCIAHWLIIATILGKLHLQIKILVQNSEEETIISLSGFIKILHCISLRRGTWCRPHFWQSYVNHQHFWEARHTIHSTYAVCPHFVEYRVLGVIFLTLLQSGECTTSVFHFYSLFGSLCFLMMFTANH